MPIPVRPRRQAVHGQRRDQRVEAGHPEAVPVTGRDNGQVGLTRSHRADRVGLAGQQRLVPPLLDRQLQAALGQPVHGVHERVHFPRFPRVQYVQNERCRRFRIPGLVHAGCAARDDKASSGDDSQCGMHVT
jgi:hypothetical protein